MELDKRIKEGKRPLTCFDVKEAKQFIGKECYLSNSITDYADLNNVTAKRILDDVSNIGIPYSGNPAGIYCYCLPCEWAEEKKEPKYRPYTKHEVLSKFECGKPIIIRHKDDHINMFIETLSSIRIDNFMDEVHVRLYSGIVDLQKLFDEFEWQQSNGEWQPFGIKE